MRFRLREDSRLIIFQISLILRNVECSIALALHTGTL